MTPRKNTELTPAQKKRARDAEKKAKERAKLQLKKQRDKVKALQAKLKAEEKALTALLPKPARPKTNHVAGVARAAKKASDGLLQAISKAKTGTSRIKAPKVADRTVKPLEFIDGLCSKKTYLIVSHKSSDKSIRLGVRFTCGDYRMHFYPNIAAHGEGRQGKMRPNKGYETIWVSKPQYEAILDNLRQRDDTHNLPQTLVERLVRARDQQTVEAVLAAA
jgi:hypothetical protein